MEVPLFERCIYHFFRRGTLETPCPSSKFWNGGGGLLARNSIVENFGFATRRMRMDVRLVVNYPIC